MTLYEQLGGEPVLRAIIDDFVERMFGDVMIGFFFRDATKQRIAELEFQHAAEFLGGPDGPVKYKGRPLARAHKKHPIMGGHFARRTQLLRNTLADHHVAEPIVAALIEHTEALRPEITDQPDGQCVD